MKKEKKASMYNHNEHSDLEKLIKQFKKTAYTLDTHDDFLHHPIYGTTIYIATCSMELRFGTFQAHIFQDIIRKDYMVALCYGNITKAKKLYTRLHSSCVTSETLRGCDCDCVQQLEGALEIIVEKGNGVLFYLMQEGRGVGYVSKARDRMLVQASRDTLSTFEAYKALGLKKDYRRYRNVSDICTLLKIKAPLIMLTNNPDKVEAMKAHGFSIEKTQALEFEPSPFNLKYLHSKMESGHKLNRPSDTKVKHIDPPEPVIPITPRALPEAQRFIYAACYYLPIKPVKGEIILSNKEFIDFFPNRSIEKLISKKKPLIRSYRRLRNQRYSIKIHEKNLNVLLKKEPDNPLCSLLSMPYWFKVHVYFDAVTGEDFVILTYGKAQAYDVPVVRLQSESIFNRFPMTDMDNRNKFKASLKEIVRYGVGTILLLYNDGRGAGLGAYAYDKMLLEQHRSKSTDESYQQIGVGYDSRDYNAAMVLLKHHLPFNKKVQMIMNSPTSLVKKKEWSEALDHHSIDVEKWIFLEKKKI